MYGGAAAIPPSFGDPVGQEPGAAVSYGAKADAFHVSLDSAFWVYNLVANAAYGERYKDVYVVSTHCTQKQWFDCMRCHLGSS